ncbi:MAG: threonine-phosphate decarboxylase CobD [Bacillota bacterium]
MSLTAPLHGGDLVAASRRWGIPPERFLDFSANINPLGPPPAALEAARSALAGVANYPEPFARSLRAALARHHGLPEEAVLVGNGAAEVLYLLLRQAAGRRVALPAPGFAEYGRAARAAGAELLTYPPDRPTPPPGLRQGDWLILCNPHNPTGGIYDPGQVLALAEQTPATLLVDEAFIDLTEPGEAGSVIPAVLRRPNLVVARSLTKFYALPGLRIGYAVAPPAMVAALDGARDPWSVSSLAQAAALAALADEAFAARTREWVRAERPFLAAALAGLPGYTVCPPAANFVLVRAPQPAHAVQERLGPQGILIRDCRSFEGLTPFHMRLAVRTREENLRLLEALRS